MKKLILIAAPLCLASSALAQLSFTGTTITQNFDSLPTSSSVIWTNNVTLPGWRAQTDATISIFSVIAGSGTSTTGGLYSFGTGTQTDRALGYVASNGFTGLANVDKGYIGLLIKNDTTATIQNLTIGYTGEQWRRDNTVTQSLAFSYLKNTTSLTAAGYTNFAALNFDSPNIVGAASSIDGNLAANRQAISSALSGVTLDAGETIMLRWVDLNNSGNDHQMAIDDFSFSAEVVPEPATMTILAGAAAIAALRRRKK